MDSKISDFDIDKFVDCFNRSKERLKHELDGELILKKSKVIYKAGKLPEFRTYDDNLDRFVNDIKTSTDVDRFTLWITVE